MAQTDAAAQQTGITASGALHPPSPRRAWSDRLPYPWLFPLLTFAATWVVIIATWNVSDAVHRQSHGWTWYFMQDDANWFTDVAQHGYAAHLNSPNSPFSSAAFFPLFPLLIRLAGRALGSYLIGGLIVTVVAGALSSLLVWLVADRVRGHQVADRTALLYCLFPGAMAFGMLYSEGVSVALAAGAVLALLSRRWLIAGIVGALATAEASFLFVLVGVAGFAALQAIWQRREWISLIAPVLSPLGLLAFFGYLGHRYDDYRFWFQAEQKGWDEHIDWGRQTVHLLLWNAAGSHLYKVYNLIVVIMMVVIVAGVVALIIDRQPLVLILFTLATVATYTLSPANPRPRYVLCAFPLFIGLSARLPRWVYWPALALSAAGLAFVVGWWPYASGPNP